MFALVRKLGKEGPRIQRGLVAKTEKKHATRWTGAAGAGDLEDPLEPPGGVLTCAGRV